MSAFGGMTGMGGGGMSGPSGPRVPPAGPVLSRARWSATFAAFSEREFSWFFVGHMSLFMAMQMQNILRGFVAFDLTDSATALGLVGAAMALPMLVLAPFGGVAADRINKRTLLIVSQLISAVLSLWVGVLIMSDLIEFWHVLLVSLLSGAVISFNMPARMALVPQLVPRHKMMNAISLQMGGMNATRVLAPAAAGLLIAPLGVGWVYMVTTALFTLAATSELRLPKHGMVGTRQRRRLREDFLGGFSYIRREPMLLLLLSLGLIFPLFAFPVQMLLPVFAADVFDKGSSGLGFLAAATGIGGLIGAMLAANFDRYPRKGLLMLLGTIWMSGLYIAYAFAPGFIPALFFLALGNVGGVLFQATNNTIIQAGLTEEVRGRVSAVMLMSFGLMPLGVLPTSAAADAFGAPTAIAGTSVLAIVVVVGFFIASKRLRHLRVDALAASRLSPIQAAQLVAEGKISQEEADSMSGRIAAGASAFGAMSGDAPAFEPTAASAPTEPVATPLSAATTMIARVELLHETSATEPQREPPSSARISSPAQPSLPTAAVLRSELGGPDSSVVAEAPVLIETEERPATPTAAAPALPGSSSAAPGPRTSGPPTLLRQLVLAGALFAGLGLGFIASGSGELVRELRKRFADLVDPDA